MPTIQEIIQQYQGQLLAQEAQAEQRLLESYQRIYDRLERDQDALLQEIVASGGEPGRASIRKMKRFQRLMADTEAEMQRYAAVIGDSVEANALGAAELGAEQAELLIRAQFAGGPAEAVTEIMATFQRLPREAIQAMVGALQEDSPLWTRTLMSFGEDTARGVGDSLIANILAGKNPIATAREMHKAWGVPLTRALTISRTEHLRAHRMASLTQYRANAHIVKGWKWYANLDTRTCMSCTAKHGTLFSLDDTLDDHPAGRCVMIPVTPTWQELGFEGMPDTGLALEECDGQRWFEGLSEADQIDMMGEGKWEAWKAGKFEFGQLSKAMYDRDWGRTFVEASLKSLLIREEA